MAEELELSSPGRNNWKPLPEKIDNETSGSSTLEELPIEKPNQTQGADDKQNPEQTRASYVKGWRMTLITSGVLLACIVVGIDESIVSTALPTIASQFHSTEDIGSYGSAFLLPQAVLQPLFGKMYAVWSVKTIYLSSLALFEVGSIIAATAQTSNTLIGGRALSGIGAVGLTVGGLNLLTLLAEPKLQNVLIGVASATMGISSLLGPLLGGVLIHGLNWRWCFWINVPIGGAVFLLLLVSLLIPICNPDRSKSLMEKLLYLDIVGTLIFAACIVPLLMALQLGVSHPWSDPTIIALLVVSGVSVPVLIIQQKMRKREGLFPLRILSQRNVWATCGLLSSIFAALGCILYYLPLFFQAVQGLSALQSGLRTMAFVCSSTVGISLAVAATSIPKVLYLNPLVILGSALFLVSTRLFATFKPGSSTAYVVGIQILAGGGFGLCILSQTIFPRLVLSQKDLQICHSVTLMLQVLASSLSIQLSNIALSRIFLGKMNALNLSATIQLQISNDVENIRNILPAELVSKILDAYSSAFSASFNIGIATAATAFLFGLCCQWKKLEGKEKKEPEPST